MLQQLVVALAVLGAALYTTWALAPARLRLAALTRLDAALGPGPSVLRERVVAPLLRRAMPAGGCSSCDSGGAPTTARGSNPAVPSATASADAAPGARRRP